jgi:hypothetical protein
MKYCKNEGFMNKDYDFNESFNKFRKKISLSDEDKKNFLESRELIRKTIRKTNQSKITPMPTLKKPFSLLLILIHLNAFVLSGVGNAYAVNQEVNTAKSLQTFVDVATILLFFY